jgi:hypothetical protein
VIYDFAPNGSSTVFASGLSPYGLAFNSSGTLYEADYGNGAVFDFTASGYRSALFSASVSPIGVAIQPLPNSISMNPFSITSASLDATGTNLVVCWQTVVGGTYTVLTNDNLASSTWTAVGSPIQASNTTTCFTLPGGIKGKTNVFVMIKQ